ncbi:hypothetical protein ACWDUL_08885 [Nocardia niigatensis]
MTGMEVIVGMIAGWLVTKANRAAGRLDAHADQVVDAAADRLWDVVSRKLQLNPGIQQLVNEAEAQTGQTVSDDARRQARLALEEAVASDALFAAELEAAAAQLQAAMRQSQPLPVPSVVTTTGAVTNTGTVQGSVIASQITGPVKTSNKTVNQVINYAETHPRRVLVGGAAVLVVLVIIVLVAASLTSSGDDRQSGGSGVRSSIPALVGGATPSPIVATTSAGTGAQSGILVHFTSGKGTNGIRNKETIGFLDPKTGQYQKVREFDISGWTGYFYNYELVFSPTLDRYAMSKTVDGIGHAGWVDANGRFTDVTAGQKAGPFEESFSFDSIGFGRNGDFYYSRVSSERKYDVYRLSAGTTSGGQLIKTLGPHATVAAWREGDGSISVYGSGDESAKGNCEYSMSDVSWISPTTYIIGGGTHLYKVTNSAPDCPKTDLLPVTNQATVTNPVVSADGKHVAFSYNGTDLYTVDTDGGTSPTLVSYPKDSLRSFQLLRWI